MFSTLNNKCFIYINDVKVYLFKKIFKLYFGDIAI